MRDLKEKEGLYVSRTQVQPTEPDKVYGSDVTFLKSREGWVYLCVVMDLFSKMIIGWSMGRKHDSELVQRALNSVLNQRSYPKGVLFHSDRGSEYSSFQIQSFLKHLGC